MSLVELISLLRKLKIKLWVDGDNLRLSAPPDTLTPELRQELAHHKTELIAFLQQATLPLSNTQPSIQIKPRPGRLPLSFAQERLWFIHQLEPDSPMYNIPLAFRLLGRVDVATLQDSLSLVIKRHETLRTIFNDQDGHTCQVILPPKPFQLQQVDLPGNWQDWIQTEANRAFDLTRESVLRASLLKLGQDEFVLFLNIHHIAADGWSISVLLREISEAYSAFVYGRAVSLPPLPVQYADFAIWQKEWLQDKTLKTQVDYWRSQLEGIPYTLELPTDQPRPAVQTYRGAVLEFPLPPNLLERLQAFSNQQGVTLFMTLLAAFQALMYRYSNQTQFTLGTTIANRTRTEIEGLIGFFVNTLVLHADLSGDPSFLELLQRVRESSLGAYAHQDLPFERLVDELKVERDTSRSALFQVMFILQNAPTSSLAIPKININEVPIATSTSKFDLTFYVTETNKGNFITIQYSTDLFEAETIERLARHYQHLLESILANPGQKIASLPFLTQAERHQILVEWNDTKVEFPQGQCVQDWFEAQVERTPEAVAVVFENQSLTYHDLNQKSNQLAHHLQTLGVGPDSLVGICVERSLEMVIGLYSILKAGGAYVPLDPTYPPERLAFMLEDAGVKVLLTQEKLLPTLREYASIRTGTSLICMDCDWPQIATHPVWNPARQATPANLAYLIYTSGSTGKPKGALNTHAGIFNRMVDMQRIYPITSADSILQKTPFSFDVSVWEFLLPLMFGARLVVARPEGHKDPQYLIETIQREKISIIHFVPSMLYAFLETPGASDCRSLKWVLSGGEVMPIDLMKRFFALMPAPVELHNMYGPAETAVDISYWPCRPDAPLSSGVPIGCPVANTQLYILDGNLQLLPVGVPGELHVSGVQVGRGYLNRPELTAEKFIPNPFGNGQLYKTGDLAHYLPDGNIEFLGRIDNQVKLRGFRIELGEIEFMLGQHPDVRKVVVVARPGPGRENRLVAYLILGNSARKDEVIPALRDSLKRNLPDYMLPSAFVTLEKFPLNPSGKIDRRALPEPDTTALANTVVFVPPQSSTEQVLADIWAELLDLPRVGRYDNFFELGGDSILSLQFINRARAKGLQITPHQVFEAQTIEALANRAIQNEPILEEEQGLVLGDVPLTPIQLRFFENHPSNPNHYNQSVLMDLQKTVEVGLLTRALEHLFHHHDTLRLRYEATEQGWRQWLAEPEAAGGLVQLVDLSNLTPSEQQRKLQAVNMDLQSGLNLQKGPILKLAIFHFGPDQPQKLLFVIHHLAIDFVSWQILISDLWTVYNQLENSQPPQLSGKSNSFKAWAEWLTKYAHQEKLQSELTYWLASGREPFHPLPVDFPEQRKRNQVAEATSISASLSAAETQALLRDVPAVYHTQINDILLTALNQVFAAWTGQPTLLIDLEGHGREAETLDLARTVGWFTSVFPVCLRLEGQENGAMIKSVKEQLRRIPNKGMGFGVLRYLNPETAPQLAALPQAEVCFNYGGQMKTVAVQTIGGEWAEDEDLGYLFTISGAVVNDQLTLSWLYSRELYRRETVENLAQAFVQALKGLIAHCQSPQAGGYTPSDFPLATLSQTELDRLIGRATDIADVYPLSPLQAVMLSQSIAAPQSGLYFNQSGFQLSGTLDIPRFKAAWQNVVNRHTILRTSFAWQGFSEPLQIVHQKATLVWDEQDWRAVPFTEHSHRLEKLLRNERQKGFDLTQVPLPRCTLIRIEEKRYWFVWHFHHLLMDGWSSPILIREMLDFYENPKISLPPARPYRDYIAWLTGQSLIKAEQFWREQMVGFDFPTPLPGQKPGKPLQNSDYAEDNLFLSPTLTSALQALTQRHHLTLNTLCQGAWALVLHMHSGKKDIVFGVTVSGRSAPLPDIESRIGLFINTLPLRVKILPGIPWERWLQTLMQEQNMLEQYAYTPIDQLATWTGISSDQTLFLSNLRFQNYPVQEIGSRSEDQFRIENFVGVDRWHHPLNLVIIPGSRLQLVIDYAVRCFEPAVIRQILQELSEALSQFIQAAPGQDVASLLPNELRLNH